LQPRTRNCDHRPWEGNSQARRRAERNKKFNKEKWLKELDKLREKNWTGRYGRSIEEFSRKIALIGFS